MHYYYYHVQVSPLRYYYYTAEGPPRDVQYLLTLLENADCSQNCQCEYLRSAEDEPGRPSPHAKRQEL
jgi:hypothetical protein